MPTEREALDHLARDIQAVPPPVVLGNPGYETDVSGTPLDFNDASALSKDAVFRTLLFAAQGMFAILEGTETNMPHTHAIIQRAKELL